MSKEIQSCEATSRPVHLSVELLCVIGLPYLGFNNKFEPTDSQKAFGRELLSKILGAFGNIGLLPLFESKVAECTNNPQMQSANLLKPSSKVQIADILLYNHQAEIQVVWSPSFYTHAVIAISGFLSEKSDCNADWLHLVNDCK
jgi:hypothetical protein